MSTDEAQLLPRIQLFYCVCVQRSLWQTHVHALVEEFQRYSEVLKG